MFELDSSRSRQVPVTCFCENGSETYSRVKVKNLWGMSCLVQQLLTLRSSSWAMELFACAFIVCDRLLLSRRLDVPVLLQCLVMLMLVSIEIYWPGSRFDI